MKRFTCLFALVAMLLFTAYADAGILRGGRGGKGGGGGGSCGSSCGSGGGCGQSSQCGSGGCGQQQRTALQAGVPVPIRQGGQNVLVQRSQFVGSTTTGGAATCGPNGCQVSAQACGTGGCVPRAGVRIAQNSGQCGR